MKKINVAILGLGTVGRGVYQILQEDAEKTAHKEHLQICIKKVLYRSYHLDIPEEEERPKTANIEEIVNDPDIDIVIEVMGGLDRPRNLCVARACGWQDGCFSHQADDRQILGRNWRPEKVGRRVLF